MFKFVTAGVTAIALTLTSAAPVQARGLSEDDIGKILFGLVAAGVLSQALQNHQKPRQAAPVPQNYTQRAPAPNTRSQSDPRHRGVAILPRQCLQNVETRFGTHRIFARRCLQRNDVNIRSLPRQCAVRLRADNAIRRGYDPQCMRAAGFRARR